jgi:3-oxoacyl-[acyl-carrier protein] reductase
MDLGLKDRVAIVAASSQGLGKAVALGLAAEGAKLALCARGAEELQRTAAQIPTEALAETVDVTVESQVYGFVEKVLRKFGRIDICVTNAGGPPAKKFPDTTTEEWRSAVDLNFMSTLFFARAVLPHMKERRWGRFLTISSVSVLQPVDGLILSTSVRSAVRGLVKGLSNEYAPHNVLVNNVCPGYTATERLKELKTDFGSQIPLGRVAKPEEFADLVVFLASERASYITGVSIPIDGGWTKAL